MGTSRLCRGPRLPCRSTARLRPAPCRSLYRGLAVPFIAIQCPAYQTSTCHNTLLYCETNSASLPLYNTNSATAHLSYNTVRVLQYNGSTTNLLIAIQFQPLYSPCHNTIVVLQHKPSHSSLANLQYTSYCNTKPLLL